MSLTAENFRVLFAPAGSTCASSEPLRVPSSDDQNLTVPSSEPVAMLKPMPLEKQTAEQDRYECRWVMMGLPVLMSYTRSTPSRQIAAALRPSGETEQRLYSTSFLATSRKNSPCFPSHSLMLPSCPQLISFSPYLSYDSPPHASRCPCFSGIPLPPRSHILSAPSSPAEVTRQESGEMATVLTLPWWPNNVTVGGTSTGFPLFLSSMCCWLILTL
eukprot:751152-Hanusia_phi.AAC.4